MRLSLNSRIFNEARHPTSIQYCPPLNPIQMSLGDAADENGDEEPYDIFSSRYHFRIYICGSNSLSFFFSLCIRCIHSSEKAFLQRSVRVGISCIWGSLF